MHLFLYVGVNEMLDLRNSTLEAAKARIAELESVITRRDMIISDQKRVLEQVKEEYQEKLEVHNLLIILLGTCKLIILVTVKCMPRKCQQEERV
jgi:hypothetical protein